MIKERPILFSTPMIPPILSGSKTQTRRIVKVGRKQEFSDTRKKLYDRFYDHHGDSWLEEADCPYGNPGDRLWVRETWTGNQSDIRYKADNDSLHNFKKWRPSIHMPRWVSRITLEITGVRVERLQDISEEDARAEGIQLLSDQSGPNKYSITVENHSMNAPTAKEVYSMLWEKINGEESWTANPWVWVIDFKRVKSI